MQLYLDCDGVLANFNRGVKDIYHKIGRFPNSRKEAWEILKDNNIFGALQLMEDAMDLFTAVRHLDPIILTGLPGVDGDQDWAVLQKNEWAKQYFPGTKVCCCDIEEKKLHAEPGDILVDDLEPQKDMWTSVGGIFVHHTDAKDSIEQLKKLGVI